MTKSKILNQIMSAHCNAECGKLVLPDNGWIMIVDGKPVLFRKSEEKVIMKQMFQMNKGELMDILKIIN